MFPTKQKVLLAKEETEYGTDPTPTPAANTIDASNITTQLVGDLKERDLMRSTQGQTAPITGKRYRQVTFTCELKGSGSAGVASQLGDLLEACGFSESVDAGSSVVYKPANTGHKSITLYIYEIPDSGSTRLKKLTGARGNVTARISAGEIAMLDFNFLGNYEATTDVTAPTGMVYESTKPPIVQSSLFTYNGIEDLVVESVTLDMGNNIYQKPDINSAQGLKNFSITSRKPSGTFNPEAVQVATADWESMLLDTTEGEMSFTIGSVATEKVAILMPKVSLEPFSDGDREGALIEDLAFRANIDNGDDDVQITFE